MTLARRAGALLAGALLGIAAPLVAQGPTTAAIAGRVTDEAGRAVPLAEVVVTNEATGAVTRSRTRADGRYLAAGLAVGGPYAVTVRRLGLGAGTVRGAYLAIGQRLALDLRLQGGGPTTLPAVQTQASRSRQLSRAHTGAEAFLSDSVLRLMPVINRDLYDLVRLVPQLSTWFPLAASGASPRANAIRIDGIGDQIPSSNLAAGALYGARVLPLDAVKEYQVLFSPFDVRHGGFAGAAVDVVTRGGTNDLQGSVFATGTDARLGRDVPLVRNTRYAKEQFGASVGGPLVRDRLHFFLASELQRRTIPAVGPYVGPDGAGGGALPASPADIARFRQLLGARGLDAGSAGAVSNANPSASVFLRLDAPLPRWNGRLTARGNFASGDSAIFARPTIPAPSNCPPSACFPLSSLQHARWVDKRSVAVQLVSGSASGVQHELLGGYLRTVSGFRPNVRQPLVLVSVPAASGAGGAAVLQAGTHEIATGQRNANWSAELSDQLSFSLGAHRVTAGLSGQRFDMQAFQLRGSYGVWEFASLDSLGRGVASRYRITRDTGSVNAAAGGHAAAYLGDVWDATSRLSITVGLRADVPRLRARPPYVAAVDSALGVRTDAVPSGRVHWSPRVGFNYDLTGADGGAPAQLRGGVGLFTGRLPLFWLFGGFSGYGLAARTLQCGAQPGDAGAPPAFSADYRNPPLACAGGQSFAAAARGEIDAIDPGLRLPQTLRASLAADWQLPFGLVGTIEGLVTRATQAVFFSPLNLKAPVAADRRGRLLYGTFTAAGVAVPARVSPRFDDVVAIGNQSRDVAYDVTAELRREGRLTDGQLAVSWGRARDVQSPRPLSALLADDWRFSRPVAGRQDALTLGTSDFDQPFRVRASGTVRAPWRRFPTALSFFYVGGSGVPYTYVAGGTQSRGDLNADGAIGNDPLYIPRAATDTAEIAFGGTPVEVAAQQAAFDRFVDGAACLRRQRGRIMARNSCRAPWMHRTNVAVRQGAPSVRGQALALELQVFNLLNLLSPRWGRVELPAGDPLTSTSQIPLLSQVGQTAGAPGQPLYRFDVATSRYGHDNFDTYYQVQLAMRYTF